MTWIVMGAVLSLLAGEVLCPTPGHAASRASNLGPTFQDTTNYALQFDGTDDNVAVGNADDINTDPHDRRTIEAWFKVDDKSISDRKQVIWEEGGYNNGFNLYVYGGSLYVGAWSENNGFDGTWLQTSAIQSGAWHHVALVYDKTNDVFKGYVDGVEFGSATAPVTMNGHSGNIGIGAVRNDSKFEDSGDFGGSGHHFGGTIDEVRIWNVARTQSEIQNNRFDAIPGDTPGLVAYWQFSEGSGSTTADATGNGHEGDLNGPTWTQVQLPEGTRPVFTSTPVTNVTAGTSYQYDVVVDDPDGADANLTLSAVTTPSWLSFNSGDSTGTLSGSPSSGNQGIHQVELEATDEAGETKTQSFRIGVTPPVPTALPTDSLQLYLDAAGLQNLPDGSEVQTWFDGAGQPFNASQTAQDRRPQFVASGIDGQPSVQFDATDDNLTLGANYLFSEQDGVTVFAVLASSENKNTPFFYDFGFHSDENYGFMYDPNTARVTTPANHGGQTSSGVHAAGSGTPVVVTGEIRFGQDQRVRINGAEPIVSDAISTSQLTANEIAEWPFRRSSKGPVTIGQQAKTGNESNRKFVGEMAELIVYNRTLSETERQQVEQHLANEYNIPRTPLSGTYTIGSNGDFASFTDATRALSTRGVDGAVTFEVASGTYTEQVTIPTVPGADSSNTVTFRSQSGDSTDVVLEAETGTLVFEQAAHVRVEAMTIAATRTSDNNPVRPVVLRQSVEDVRLAHNVIEGYDGTQEAGQVLVYGDQVGMSDLKVEENRFVDTETGVWLRGNDATGTVIQGNVFENVGRRGIFLRDQTAPQVLGNQIRSGQIGIELRNSGGSSGNEALVANNMVVVSSSADTDGRGMYVNGSGSVQVYHNAVNVTDSNPVNQAFLQNGSTSGLDVKNNIWAVPGGGRAMRIDDPSSDQTYDFNDLITTGTEWVVWGDAVYTSLADYQSGTGQGANSIDVDPGYVSDTDLTPTSSQVADAGTDLTATVPRDIFGTSRTVPVSMGAVEFTAQAPVFTSTPVRSVPIGESYQYAVTVEDPDGSDANLTLSDSTRPSWLSFTDDGSGSGTLSGTPAEGNAGVHTVVLEAEDGNGNTMTQSFEVAAGNLGLTLDGTDDYVAVPDDPAINLDPHDRRTIEAWFKVNDASIGGQKQVIWEEGGRSNGFNLYVYDGRLYAGAWSEANGWNGTWLRTSAIESGTWHHVALVFDKASGTFMGYLDGDEFGRRMAPVTMNSHGPANIGIAETNSKFHDGDFGGDGHEFGGSIDEVRLWNGVRSGTEIRDARFSTLSGDETNLEAYWPIEQGTAHVVFDATGNGHDGDRRGPQRSVSGAPFGAAVFTSVPPRSVDVGASYSYSVTATDTEGDDANLTLSAPTRPSWLSFTDEGSGQGTLTGTPAESDTGAVTVQLAVEDGDGQTTVQSFEIGVGNLDLTLDGSDDQVATPLDIDQSGSTPITMEAWVYPTNSSGNRQQVVSSNDQGADWSILRDGGTWYVYTGENPVSTGLRVETDTWQHVAAVFVPGTGVRFYKNGQEVVLSSIGTDQNDSPIHIGVNPGNSSERFAGRVEDVRVWNVERTASEIETARWGPLTGGETGLQGYWSMDEKASSLLIDGSGNENHGTVRGARRGGSDVPFGHPKFTSTPVRSAEIDATYQYDVVATDTDGSDAGLTLQATSLPSWLSFSDQGSGQGTLSGTPGFTDTGTHTVELEVTDADGQTATQRYLLVVGTFARAGLQGRYYDGYYSDDHSFFEQETQAFARVDSIIDFEDTDASWDFGGTPLEDRETYSVAWTGFIDIPQTATYTFYTNSDDASYLFLDEATLNPTTQNATVRNGGLHSTNEESGTAYLTEGLHPIRVHYGENTGNDDIEVSWSSSAAGISKEIIPASALRTRAGRQVLDEGVCSPGAVTFRWRPVPDANFYRLDLATAPREGDIINTIDVGADTSYTFTGGQDGTTYFARIAASSDGGDTFDEPSGFSNGITVDQSAPLVEVPTGTARQSGAVRFDISASDNVNWTQSRVQVDTDPGFPSPLVEDTIAAGETLTVDDTTGVVLYARAAAQDCAGNTSGFSNASQGTFAKFPPVSLQAPPNGAEDTPTDSLALTWSDVSGAASYWVQVATDGGFDNLIRDAQQLDATSDTLSGLNTATTYHWRVAARNEAGVGFFSDARSFTTRPAVPAVPTLSAPADEATDVRIRPTLSWNALSDASSYRVQVDTTDSLSTPIIDREGVSGTEIQTRRLETETTYYWRVRGKSSAGTGDWSAVRSFTTETLPDLQASAVTPPSSANSGQLIEVEWTVTNDGDGPTTTDRWEDAIYLSPLANFDPGTAQRLGKTRNLTALNPGESYTATAQVRLPKGIEGDRYLFVGADDGTSQRELDEANNRSDGARFQVELTPPPDLQVPEVNAPTAAFSDDTISVNWKVKNTGNGITQSDQWHDDIYLSSDDVLDPGSDHRLGGLTHQGRLDPDSTYRDTTDLRLPLDLFGTFFVLARTDDGDDVFEHTNEDNNVYDAAPADTIQITLTPPADLSVDSVSVADSTAPAALDLTSGDTLDVSWTVQNVGANATATDRWSDRIYLSEDDTLDRGNARLLQDVTHQGGLARDARYSVERTIRLPDDISGPRFVHVETDSRDHVFEHTYEDNNVRRGPDSLQIELRPYADLRVQSIDVLNSAAAGDTLRVRWTVVNDGTTPASDWNDRVTLAPVSDLSNRTSLETAENKTELGPGETYTRTAKVHLPVDLSGLHRLFVTTDPGNLVFEHTAEDNNETQSANFDVDSAPPADLALEDLAVPSEGASGQEITLEWTVHNQGTGDTRRDAWDDGLYLSTDSSASTASATRLDRVRRRSALGTGDEYARSHTVSLPNGISGTFYVVAIADDADRVEDTDRSNNARVSTSIDVSMTPPPDLQVTGFQAPADTMAGQPFPVQWTVTNTGAGIAQGDWFDALYLSTDSVRSGSDQQLTLQERTSSVDTSAGYTSTASVRVPHTTDGQHYLIARTDERDDLYEQAQEDNNTRVAPVHFTPQPPTELTVETVTPPAQAVSGEPVSITWSLRNEGDNAATGRVVDAVYVSADSAWQVDDPLVTLHSHRIDVSPGEQAQVQRQINLAKAFKADSTGEIQEPLPGVSPGEYHLIVRTDVRNYMAETNERNNDGTSTDQTSVTVQPLALGTPKQITLQPGGRRYFRIENPEPQDLLVQLEATEGFNEMYLRQGEMPSRVEFDHKHSQALASSQTIRVAEAAAGPHFLLVRGENLPADGADVTLDARAPDFAVAALDGPQQVGNNGEVTLGVDGSNFDPGSTVLLRDPATGDTIQAELNHFVNSTRINARFELENETLGDYELVVERPDGEQAQLEQSVEVEETQRRAPIISVAGPSTMRPDQVNTFQIQIENPGNVNAEPFMFWLTMPDFVETLVPWTSPPFHAPFPDDAPPPPDPGPDFGDPLPPPGTPIGPGHPLPGVGLPIGDGEKAYPMFGFELPPDQPVSIPLPAHTKQDAPTSPNEEVCTKSGPSNLNSLNPGNKGFKIADRLRKQRNRVRSAAPKLGSSMVHGVQMITKIPAAIVDPTLTNAADVLNSAYNMFRDMNDALEEGTGERCSPFGLVRPIDPNDIVGPPGVGDPRWVAPDRSLAYKVRFENDPERATAPARTVRINVPLDPSLDRRSFELGEVNFGDLTVDIPFDQSSHTERRIDLRDSLGVFVDVTAGLDVVNDRAFWLLETIDPATGQPPDDPQSGFLPVNDSTGRGEGHVTFTMSAKSDVSNGVPLDAQARITFDTEDPIDTEVHTNTVDATPPTSAVQELPGTIQDSLFAVEWSGQDSTGSGVQSYSVFVSKDGGPFEPWRTGTPATADTFEAELGHTYRFYSLARDEAGNLEPNKTSAEASTQVGQTLSVWPGDTDNDGAVNEQDVLPVGQYYGMTGPSRTLASGFAPAPVLPWSPDSASYADANGTGAIDQNDILPIGTHYGKTHETSGAKSSANREPVSTLRIRPLSEGTTLPLYLRAGTEDEPVRKLLGVAAALSVPPEAFSVEAVEPTGILGDDVLPFHRYEEDSGRLGLAYTRRRPDGPAPSLADTAVVKMTLRVKRPMAEHAEIGLLRATTTGLGRASRSSDEPPVHLESPFAADTPAEYALKPNYPNPTARQTTIRFALPEPQSVTLRVYDVLGRRVATLVRGKRKDAGWHALRFDASRLASGTYFYRLQAGDFRKTQKMVVIR